MTQDDERRGRPGAEDQAPCKSGSAHEPQPRSLEQTFELDHAPEKVWTALTRGDLLARWLLPCDLGAGGEGRLEPGVSFALAMPESGGADRRVECEVVDVEPGRRVGYTWRTHRGRDASPEGAVDTLVTFELTPLPLGRTRLRVRQVEIPALAQGATVTCLAASRARRAPPAMAAGGTRSWTTAPLHLAA